MTSFKSDRINSWKFIIVAFIKRTAILFLIGLIDILFLHKNLFEPSTWLIAFVFFSIAYLFTLYVEDRINEIIINLKENNLKILYFDINQGQTIKELDLNNVQVKINRSRFFDTTSIGSIKIFTNEKEMYTITKSKDGFSQETLNKLGNFIESSTNPTDRSSNRVFAKIVE
jgi:hypothetical protein